MAREQGDELGDPVVFVTADGEERSAYTPVDEVNFAARGWVRRDNSQPAAPPLPHPKSQQRQVQPPTASPGAESA